MTKIDEFGKCNANVCNGEGRGTQNLGTYRLTPGFLGTDGRNSPEDSDCLTVNLARMSDPCARRARVCAKGSPVSVSEMLCRRVLLPVCMLIYMSLKTCSRVTVTHCAACDMLLSRRRRCMPCRACTCTSLHLRLIELAMLIIFSMPVKFHAYRWGS